MKRCLTFLFPLVLTAPALARTNEIKIGILQPNLAEETEYSPIYRMGFEAGLFYNLGRTNDRLEKCGYTARYSFSYYPHGDQAIIRTKAEALEKDGAWIIFGPDRSNHFLAASKGVSNTLLLSAMANAQEVTSLPWPYFTMYPSNKLLAGATHEWVKRNPEYGGEFAAVNDPNCKFCADFLAQYSALAGKPRFIYETAEETFDPEKLKSLIRKDKITSLLLPVYSAFTGKIISSLRDFFPDIRFIGSSGWGDELDHVPKFPIGQSQKGFSVRLGRDKPDILKQLKMENMQFVWNGKLTPPPDSIYLYKEALDKIAGILCAKKPRSKAEFLAGTKELKNDEFISQLGFGVFELSGRKIRFKTLLNGNGSVGND